MKKLWLSLFGKTTDDLIQGLILDINKLVIKDDKLCEDTTQKIIKIRRKIADHEVVVHTTRQLKNVPYDLFDKYIIAKSCLVKERIRLDSVLSAQARFAGLTDRLATLLETANLLSRGVIPAEKFLHVKDISPDMLKLYSEYRSCKNKLKLKIDAITYAYYM